LGSGHAPQGDGVSSIGRLGTSGGAEYYLDKVANNVDDYYLGHGEAPGQWIGATSAQFGLFGQVDAQPLRNPLAGLSGSGKDLGARLADRRPGYDLTFSAPKGVSLLWALGPAQVSDACSGAHDGPLSPYWTSSPLRPASFAEELGAIRSLNPTVSSVPPFGTRTSRAGDPQLHTHVAVPNLVKGADGRWSAPDGRHLYTWKKAAGTLYQSALRAELAPLGLAWHVRHNGLGSSQASLPARRPTTTATDVTTVRRFRYK
jgi:conjugative relaxase-like TrwC/TraI family protein